jgi:hypothetical protein
LHTAAETTVAAIVFIITDAIHCLTAKTLTSPSVTEGGITAANSFNDKVTYKARFSVATVCNRYRIISSSD